MAEISAIAGVGQQLAGDRSVKPIEPVSHEILNLFEHLLGQKAVEPSGPARDAIANILANPSTLGDHILANVEGMHQSFNEFSEHIETRLAPPGAEGMSLAPQGPDTGGISSQLDAAFSDAGPAAGPLESPQSKSDVSPEYEGWQGEMQELLWVQYNVGRILVHEEMMSKAAGKSTQNLDMLLRGQ